MYIYIYIYTHKINKYITRTHTQTHKYMYISIQYSVYHKKNSITNFALFEQQVEKLGRRYTSRQR